MHAHQKASTLRVQVSRQDRFPRGWVGARGGGISCELEGESGEGTQSHSIAKRGPAMFEKTGKARKKRGWQVVACTTHGISGRRVAEKSPMSQQSGERKIAETWHEFRGVDVAPACFW